MNILAIGFSNCRRTDDYILADLILKLDLSDIVDLTEGTWMTITSDGEVELTADMLKNVDLSMKDYQVAWLTPGE